MLALVLALMLAAAIFAVLWPLSRDRVAEGQTSDVAIFRDQLAEIDRDLAVGAIAASDADAARREVSRRLIAAGDVVPAAIDASARLRHRRIAAVLALAAIPILAAAVYLMLGSPGLPGQPYVARTETPPEDRSIASLIARVEAHLDRNPEDGRGWEVVAPVYLRLGRYDDAVRAERSVIRLLGESAKRQADLGEALVAAASGVVTTEAKGAFERAVHLDRSEPRGQFYLGVAAEQDGRRADAAKLWRKLVAQGPSDAPWMAVVRRSLERVEANKEAVALGSEDIASAAEMPRAERERMVRGMVERLAERLNTDGADVDGWLRLMRAYMVLGERDKARNAATQARRALQDEPEKVRRIDESAKDFGLEG
jgi:cytochrome c-type biogenesis protein CcmH